MKNREIILITDKQKNLYCKSGDCKIFLGKLLYKNKKKQPCFLGSSFCELKFDVWSNPQSADTLSQLMYTGTKLISDGKIFIIKDKRKFVVGSSLGNWGIRFRFTADDYTSDDYTSPASSDNTGVSGVSG